MKYSRPKFHANAKLSSQVVCCKHYISMYLDEYLAKRWLSASNNLVANNNTTPLECKCNMFQIYLFSYVDWMSGFNKSTNIKLSIIHSRSNKIANLWTNWIGNVRWPLIFYGKQCINASTYKSLVKLRRLSKLDLKHVMVAKREHISTCVDTCIYM